MKEMHKHGVAASLNMDWKGVYRGQDGRIKITDGLYRRTLLTMTPEYLQDAAERDDTFAGWTREQMFQQLCKQANRLTLDVLEPYMDA
jgi:hypothetical protein